MMKKSIVLVLFLYCFGTVCAQKDWAKLFNGKDLTGWTQLNGKASYKVENGEIVGTTVFNEPNSFLATTATYRWNSNLMMT
jgi:Domain of Unknown Function (DUF1080)